MEKKTVKGGAGGVRRQLVARRALPLFVRLGYDKVSFQDLAEASGVPRTAIYRCFRSKREIFDAAILEVILEIRSRFAEIRAEEGSAAVRLGKIAAAAMDFLFRERDFVAVIFDFVLAKIAAGEDMAARVTEFTSGLKTTFRELTEEGVADGSLKPGTSPALLAELLFANVEATALKMLIGIEQDGTDATRRAAAILSAVTRTDAFRFSDVK